MQEEVKFPFVCVCECVWVFYTTPRQTNHTRAVETGVEEVCIKATKHG